MPWGNLPVARRRARAHLDERELLSRPNAKTSKVAAGFGGPPTVGRARCSVVTGHHRQAQWKNIQAPWQKLLHAQ